MKDDDEKKIQKDLLWGLYQEYRNHARHAETMRANITNYLIASSAGLVSLIAFGGVERGDFPLILMLMFVGFLGALFSASYTEHSISNRRRAALLIEELNNTWFIEKPSKNIADILERAKALHKEESLLFTTIRAIANSHVLWVVFPLCITLIGIILIVAVYLKEGG